MRRRLARQSLVALAVLVAALMAAGFGLAGRQAYATEDADAPSITLTFEAGDGGAVGPDESLVQAFSPNDDREVVPVTATPSKGYAFVDWTRDGVEVSTDATFAPAKETAAYVANFKAVDANGPGPASADEVDLGSNPDHLDGPGTGDGVIDENVYPEVDFGSSASLSHLLGVRLMALPAATSAHPTQPGQVVLSKTADPVDGMVNTWDVTVRVEGKDATKRSDVVLVIDRSGSMGSNGRMTAAQDAAKRFVSTLLPDENTRIAVVSFASDVSLDQALTNDAGKLDGAIDGLKANGGTFTQAGIRQAESILANSNADVKNIVLLSDGEPTYSYAIRNPTSYLTDLSYGHVDDGRYTGGWDGWHYDTDISVPSSQFDYTNFVGKGTSLQYHGGQYARYPWYYNHGNSTIAEAGFAKGSGYTMWSVAVNAGDAGTQVLTRVADDANHAKSTEDPAELAKIFTEIAGNIKSAVQGATVSDPMGTGFTVIGGVSDIKTSQGEATYDADTKTIGWSVGTPSTPLADDPTVKYAELTYRITIDDSILTATSTDGRYATNGETAIKYRDVTGADQTGEFESPTVDPILLILQKRLYDKTGAEVTDGDQTFSVRVKSNGAGAQGYDKTYVLRPGEKKVLTNLRLEDTYTVEESAYPEGASASDYTTTVNVYGTDTNAFQIRQGGEDSPVIVTNREHPTLTLSKTADGPLADKTKEFRFDVTVKRGGQTIIDGKEYALKGGESTTIAPEDGALLPGDQVTIQETNGDGYTTTYVVNKEPAQTGRKASLGLSGDTTVSFTNTKRDVPITALDGNDWAPALPAILGTGSLIAVLCVAITRHRSVRGE